MKLRQLLLGSKAMTNLGNVLKSRDISLLSKVCIIKAMVFPVVMYWCESWTIKKAECWRIDAVELWCWRRFWRVPSTARRSNQSILKKINPKIFTGRTVAEALVLWISNVKSWLIGKYSEVGKDWKQKEKRAAKNHRVNGCEYEQTLGDSGRLWHATDHGVPKSWTRLSNQTTAGLGTPLSPGSGSQWVPQKYS